jgi:hypothetical protein
MASSSIRLTCSTRGAAFAGQLQTWMLAPVTVDPLGGPECGQLVRANTSCSSLSGKSLFAFRLDAQFRFPSKQRIHPAYPRGLENPSGRIAPARERNDPHLEITSTSLCFLGFCRAAQVDPASQAHHASLGRANERCLVCPVDADVPVSDLGHGAGNWFPDAGDVPSQSLKGSNSPAPAIATANGRSV